MTAAEFERVEALILNIIGFNQLAEDHWPDKTPLQQLTYDAQVYACGVALATLLCRVKLKVDEEPE
ncbi:hypothetical protein HGP16_29265 [Rhizobium sp. P40RR-XXII]|uniref:hypothetical protein n=1 Tax=unclassified Rhizobium TaxID=2613769 RepID=UPI001457084D|nr:MULTISPECIES: hypothetical protein [unclassified Rhizobium]NLR88911.1 hypothetical protein [Rhizobium sp. P28RR-XV]NLS20611.1 hypothetical protein [Rhizobium sp. P40RR-XXII]